jgi:SPP1 gp7 family putative phage head morphogenesis protein
VSDKDIYTVTDEFRLRLLKQEREAAAEMTRVYARLWSKIKGEIDDLLAAWDADGGVNAGPDWIYRYDRLRKLENQIRGELTRFTQYAGGAIDQSRRSATRLGAEAAFFQVGFAGAFDRMPAEAIERMAGMLAEGSPLALLLNQLPNDGAKVAGDALIQGLGLGKGAREIARDMRAALGGNLVRALRIARTETMRAYREATRAYYRQSGVVKQWEWRSARNERTCAACWAMDGKRFDLSEPMPAHVNCRCTMIPVTQSWDELGFSGIEELEQTAPALDVFANLRPDQQLMVLGPAKFAAYQAGALKLPDLVGWKNDPLWGTSVFEKGLGSLGLDAHKFLKQATGVKSDIVWLKSSFGVRVEIDDEQIRQLITDALKTIQAQGFDFPKVIRADVEFFRRYKAEDSPAAYFKNVLRINPAHEIWGNPPVYTQARFSQKEWSFNKPEGIIWHETAHYLHEKAAQGIYRKYAGGGFANEDDKMIARLVSRYAEESADEFVAEVFAAHISGLDKNYSAVVFEMLKKYKGLWW